MPAASTNDVVCDETDLQRRMARPECLDDAIETLKTRTDPAANNDLAVAYYARAVRDEQPVDYFNAWDAADRAVKGGFVTALFNRALAEEALGLHDAAATWDAFLARDHSAWATEARSYRNGSSRGDAAAWRNNQPLLAARLRNHNVAAAAALINGFPSAAEALFEDEFLTASRLPEAKTFAAALSAVIGDRYALEVVAALERSPAAFEAAMRFFREARAIPFNERPKSAAPYAKAAELFERIQCPLGLDARLGVASATAVRKDIVDAYERAVSLIDPVEQELRSKNHRLLLARSETARAFYLMYAGRYIEAIDEHSAALALYAILRDRAHLSDLHSRQAGAYRLAGLLEAAWAEELEALKMERHVLGATTRHTIWAEAAEDARALGHPQVALLYANTALRIVNGNSKERAIALRRKAEIELAANELQAARRDFEAAALDPEQFDPNILKSLQARSAEIEGRTWLSRGDPKRSADAFARALALIPAEQRTYRASLAAQFAAALTAAGRRQEAEGARRRAIDDINAEEQQLLKTRARGKGEDLWSGYFSRFPDPYDQLIAQLTAEGKKADAFIYAERERAFEPLALARGDAQTSLPTLHEIQAALPDGTLLLEYALLSDRTIVWLITHDTFDPVTLPATRRQIERWQSDLITFIRGHNAVATDTFSSLLYDALLKEPLHQARRPVNRLVVIPDGVMHAIPLGALRNAETKHYLMQDLPIETAPSAALYLHSLQRDRHLAGKEAFSALLVGNPAFDRKVKVAQRLRSLPNAEDEVLEIAAIYAPYSATTLIGAAATPRAFLNRAQGSTVIHVAGHAIVNPRQPSRSLLMLAADGERSGAVEAQELITGVPRLDHTRLVVLGACSSAGGLPIGPQGVAPLVRPFIVAGAPAVIGTLWNVNDDTAKHLLVSLHQHYRSGDDAAVALQRAQVEMLRGGPALRSVLAWAPFQVIGHSSSPFAPRETMKRRNQNVHPQTVFHRPDGLRSQPGRS